MDDDANAPASGEAREAALEAQLAAALAERNALWADAQKARALELEVTHTRAIIDEMKRSVSWRLTTPIRELKVQSRAGKKTAGRVRRTLRGS